MGDWKPDQVARVQGGCDAWCTAYLWIVPAKAGGTWTLAEGELVIQQTVSIAHRHAQSRGGKTLAISSGKLEGERISFSVGTTQYVGRVNGDVMEGTSTAGASRSPWNATRSR